MTVVGSLLVATPAGGDTTGAMEAYVVLYKDGASSSRAASAVQQAGGTLVWNYSEIGVVIARSSSTSFKSAMQAAAGVEGVAATSCFATRIKDDQADDSASPNAPATTSDPLAGLQWDMV
jgi:lantibiotic leader peptide-processing serine protease